MQLEHQGLRLRLRYPWADATLEEEIRTVAEYLRVATPMGFGMGETIYWTLTFTLAHRAPVGTLDAMSRQRTQDELWDRWSRRQDTMDRAADQCSQALRGVDSYVDPSSGRSTELPGGYGQAWTNGLGEYIVSDDPTYDPNLTTNASWTPMRRE